MKDCETCRFFYALTNVMPEFGECRRRSPVISDTRVKTEDSNAEWPIVWHLDWCGEWQKKRINEHADQS